MDKPRRPLANLITLGAADVPALRDFYRALGWPVVIDDGDLVAFELRWIVLALFPVDKLAADGRARQEPGQGGIRFTIAIMAESRDEVDEMTDQVRRAGGRITKEPVKAEFFEGR